MHIFVNESKQSLSLENSIPRQVIRDDGATFKNMMRFQMHFSLDENEQKLVSYLSENQFFVRVKRVR